MRLYKEPLCQNPALPERSRSAGSKSVSLLVWLQIDRLLLHRSAGQVRRPARNARSTGLRRITNDGVGSAVVSKSTRVGRRWCRTDSVIATRCCYGEVIPGNGTCKAHIQQSLRDQLGNTAVGTLIGRQIRNFGRID